MKDSITQSMDWLHTWGGLLSGWLLFAIFLTGTLTVFEEEITYWMQPELHPLPISSPRLEAVTDQLSRLAPKADWWRIELPSDRMPIAEIWWQYQGQRVHRILHPATGDVVVSRDTRGGDFFYRFHYHLLLDRLGIWIVGAAAMAMLTALVTGLVIHHRIFKDFFTFRPQAASHRAWLDAHNVTSVLVLPFHLMITFTGLVIMWSIYMPAGLQLVYGGDVNQFWADIESRTPRGPSQQAAPLVSLADLERRARPYWQGGQTKRIFVRHPGDRHATVEISRRSDDRLALVHDRVSFDGVTGEILDVQTTYGPAFLTQTVLSGLHFVQFGGPPMRWLYFLMGLAASAMIATGLVLWIIKRRERQAHSSPALSFHLVEALNVSAVAGLLVATGVFFWVNRLLPVELEQRALWELRCFFIAWTLCAIHSFMRLNSVDAWKEQLTICALLFGFLPLLNAMTTGTNLMASIPHGLWSVAGIDLTALAMGVLLGWTAWSLGKCSSHHIAALRSI